MANIKSAKKRILVQAKREARNKAYRTNLKTVLKKLTQLSQKTQRIKMLWLKQLLKQLTRLVQKVSSTRTALLERNPLSLLWQNSFCTGL